MVTRYIGRCGVCEGDYKLLGGALVHHGYRRPGHGYIVGDCFGVGYAPYERSTAASAAYRESCEAGQERLRSYLGRLRAGEVRELTVYKTERFGFGQRRDVPEILHADSDDLGERDKFQRALDRELSETRRRIEFFAMEIKRMSRLIDSWVERPLRTVEEFEREAESVTAAQRGARAAERAEKRRAKEEKSAALAAKRAGWEAEKRALMDKYRELFTRAALESPPNRHIAREDWRNMHRAKERKGYLDFYPKELGVDAALIKLGLAQWESRNGHTYMNYASAYGTGLTPNETHTPNGGYYVWVLDEDGQPLLEGPYGPHDLERAKQLARIGATEGDHNRAVSRGLHPTEPSFEVVREYEAGTGERVV